jgi:nucleoside-diphosphate-sugar epimerase
VHSFGNKVVLVTGGSRGIGRALAVKFSQAGATVVITYKSKIDPNFFNPKGIRYSSAILPMEKRLLLF